jgi:predicted RNA-binding protein YlxR (DUF448 family)
MPSPAPTAAAPKFERRRTCVGCGVRSMRAELVRFVGAPIGIVVVSEAHRRQGLSAFNSGRGAYVHPAPKCVARAGAAGFSRSFRRAAQVPTSRVAAEISSHFGREGNRLVEAGRRRGVHVGVVAPSASCVEAETGDFAVALGAKFQRLYWMREGLRPLTAAGDDVCSRSLEVR